MIAHYSNARMRAFPDLTLSDPKDSKYVDCQIICCTETPIRAFRGLKRLRRVTTTGWAIS